MPFEDLHGMRVGVETVDGEELPGTVVDVRDDHPDPDDHAYRVVVDTPEGEIDVAKERLVMLD